ncbi:MAG: regulatory protein RecX [Methylococcaceae bacterium]
MREVSFALLAKRELSREELTSKLCSKGYPLSLVQEVLDDLVSEGFQSDVRCAESLTRSRVGKGLGPRRIEYDLRQKGLSDDIGMDANLDWDFIIMNAYTKKFKENLVPTCLQDRLRRERFLISRGFTWDQIGKLFRRIKDDIRE